MCPILMYKNNKIYTHLSHRKQSVNLVYICKYFVAGSIILTIIVESVGIYIFFI